MSACASGAAKLARRQHGEKSAVLVSAVEKIEYHAAGLFLFTFFFFSYTVLTSTEPGASAVENFGYPRY